MLAQIAIPPRYTRTSPLRTALVIVIVRPPSGALP